MPQAAAGTDLARAAALPLAALLVAVALEAPFRHDPIARDSGIHMTAAREILAGRVMYRDLWENRPPGIHYANALAFSVFGCSLSVVSGANIFMLFVNALLFRALARGFVQRRALWVATLVFLFYLGAHANRDECDAIELYMVFPMMLTALFGLRLVESRRPRWALLAGAAAGLAVLFKQPAASAGLAVALTLILTTSGRRERLVALGLCGFMALGAALVWTPVLLYFAAHRALGPLWDCLWTYNALYMSGVGLARRLDVIGYGFTRIGSALPLWAGCAAMVMALAAARRGTPLLRLLRAHAPHVLLSLWALLDLAAVCYPGFRNPHYFLQIVPAWTLLGAALGAHLWSSRSRGTPQRRCACAVLLLAAALALLNAAVHQTQAAGLAIEKRMRRDEFTLNEAISYYMQRRTRPNETICIWGAEADVYFIAQRQIASRYFFIYPLQMPDYRNAARVAQYVEDLKRANPVYIVDLSAESDYAVPLFGEKKVPPHFAYHAFQPIRDYVRERYVRRRQVKVAPFYVRRDAGNRSPAPMGSSLRAEDQDVERRVRVSHYPQPPPSKERPQKRSRQETDVE